MFNYLDHSQKRNALKKLRFLSNQYVTLKNQNTSPQELLKAILERIYKLVTFLKYRVAAKTIRSAIHFSLFSLLISANSTAQNFEPAKNIAEVSGTPFLFPELVDYDSDGDLDIVGAGISEAALGFDLFFLENDGTAEQAEYNNLDFDHIQAYSLTPYAIYFETADLDNDGDIDFTSIFYIEEDNSYVVLLAYYENIGNNQLADPQTIDLGGPLSSSYIFDFSLVDFDDDGDLDVLSFGYDYLATEPNAEYYAISLFYFENKSTSGGLEFGERITNPNNFSPIEIDGEPQIIQIEVDDYDGDGDLDVIFNPIFEDFGKYVEYFENTPDGFVSKGLLDVAQDVEEYMLMSSGDIDSDGDVDLLYSSFVRDYDSVNELFWFENNSNISSTNDLMLKGDFQLSQNPTVDRLDLSYIVENSISFLQISIVDAQGKIHFSNSESQIQQSGILSFDVASFPEGMYYLNLMSQELQTTIPFAKVE